MVVMGVAPSPPPSPGRQWWGVVLRFLALRLADAVVYAMCAALLLLSAGTALSVLAGRVGASARLAGLATIAGACLFPFYIVGFPLFVWRSTAAEAARRSSGKEAPPAGETSKKQGSSVLGDLRARTPTRWRVFYMFSLLFLAGQLIKMCSPVEGSFEEKLASLLWDLGVVGMALVQGCWFAPSMAMEWTAAQRTCAGLKKNELPV